MDNSLWEAVAAWEVQVHSIQKMRKQGEQTDSVVQVVLMVDHHQMVLKLLLLSQEEGTDLMVVLKDPNYWLGLQDHHLKLEDQASKVALLMDHLELDLHYQLMVVLRDAPSQLVVLEVLSWHVVLVVFEVPSWYVVLKDPNYWLGSQDHLKLEDQAS